MLKGLLFDVKIHHLIKFVYWDIEKCLAVTSERSSTNIVHLIHLLNEGQRGNKKCSREHPVVQTYPR